MSDFFKPPPQRHYVFETLPSEEWMGPPHGVVPALVPIERLLARTEDVAVYLSGCWVYPAGFEFEVFVVARVEDSSLDPFSFEHDVEADRTGEISPGKLRLGLQFADGTILTNTGRDFEWEWGPGGQPKVPRMSGTHGGGGEGDWHQAFWVWPLPPAGSLELVYEWPVAGIPLGRTELDAVAIIDAASRAQVIF
jgi:hypothetical protein